MQTSDSLKEPELLWTLKPEWDWENLDLIWASDEAKKEGRTLVRARSWQSFTTAQGRATIEEDNAQTELNTATGRKRSPRVYWGNW